MAHDVLTAYRKFADLRNLGTLKERLDDPAVAEKMAQQLSADKMEEARRQLDNMQFDEDSVTIQSPMGAITLRIVEREEPKLVKFQAENSPVPVTLWLQLLPVGESESKLRVTLGAELNIFIKQMVGNKLQQAADGLANILATV